MRWPPAWKVRRELRRIGQQLAFPLVILIEQGYVKSSLRLFPQLQKIWNGQAPLTRDVAIFHTYQPNGLSETSFETVTHLKDKGFSVILVSNAPLSDVARRRLSSLCYRVVQRPNFGYDFGGYQFAIRTFILPAEAPKNLLLVNDSIWFPLFPDTALLDQLRSATFDVTGPVLYKHRTPKHVHIQTYMIRFSQSAIANPAFRSFWQSYRASRLRVWTIRHGEMRLSEIMRRAGLSVGGLNEAHSVLSSELEQVTTWANTSLDTSAATDKILQDPTVEPSGAPSRIQRVERGKSYLLSSDPGILLGSRGLAFLKKDRGENYRLQRLKLLTHPACASLLARMSGRMREEIASWDRQD
jgi:hypothetical protein